MDIITAIDEATGCQQCGKPLERSVSDDFCGEWCQRQWHAERVGALADRLTHGPPWVCRQIPADARGISISVPQAYLRVNQSGDLELLVRPDIRALSEAFGRMSEALARITHGMSVSATRVNEALAALAEPGKKQAARRSAMDKALEARRTRNTGPAPTSRAPRAINPRRTR